MGLDLAAASLRRYRREDRAACAGVFDSNVPKYFAEVERAGFLSWLDSAALYWVIELADRGVVACGGYEPVEQRREWAALCWGMVRRDLHGLGLGTILLRERLQRIDADPGFAATVIETTQFSSGFYARHGFAISRFQRDGFAPGYDLLEMRRPAPARAV